MFTGCYTKTLVGSRTSVIVQTTWLQDSTNQIFSIQSHAQLNRGSLPWTYFRWHQVTWIAFCLLCRRLPAVTNCLTTMIQGQLYYRLTLWQKSIRRTDRQEPQEGCKAAIKNRLPGISQELFHNFTGLPSFTLFLQELMEPCIHGLEMVAKPAVQMTGHFRVAVLLLVFVLVHNVAQPVE